MCLVGCIPAELTARAAGELHVRERHVTLMASDTIGDRSVWVFCRERRAPDRGAPWPSGWQSDRCVTLVCPVDGPWARCSAN
jgi:hypothetical protein